MQDILKQAMEYRNLVTMRAIAYERSAEHHRARSVWCHRPASKALKAAYLGVSRVEKSYEKLSQAVLVSAEASKYL